MEAIESFRAFVRRPIHARQMSLRTEEAYLLRIRQFIAFQTRTSDFLRPLDAGLLAASEFIPWRCPLDIRSP